MTKTKSPTCPPRRPRRDRAVPPLSDLDMRILALLSRHRVLTQNHLSQIVTETPIRTLRYRCARLARHRLVGRSRPYRERGSAPHHFWPTRRGEAILTGGPPPRGGERREPNPLFLAHAAALSDLYVALATGLPAGIELVRFEREGEARESFAGPARKARAVAPDAYIEITDADGHTLSALVELDMGTMSHRRLKAKAAGYAEYARADAWCERHPFCPALLFVTTTEKRARSFLASMLKELGRKTLLLTCACDLARRLTRISTEPRWRLSADEGAGVVDLLSALREARRPHDEEVASWEAWRREKEAKTERLRSDPEALRDHLRRSPRQDWGFDRLGRSVAEALRITLEGNDPLAGSERGAFRVLGALLADPVEISIGDREPTAAERSALDDLIDYHRADQLRQVDDLTGRLGAVPVLRRARDQLEAGDLLDASDASALALRAEDDRRSRVEQERLCSAYLAWREGEARRLAKGQGFAARLRRGPDDFLEEVDRRALRICSDCKEIAYPDPERVRYRRGRSDVASRCHFCGRGDLLDFEPPIGG
ncbi:MAG: replication-relaxation family protein [Actinobacteria bacterium]|nr:replication-relaxation family protein [Actinomycetota bacterium]